MKIPVATLTAFPLGLTLSRLGALRNLSLRSRSKTGWPPTPMSIVASRSCRSGLTARQWCSQSHRSG